MKYQLRHMNADVELHVNCNIMLDDNYTVIKLYDATVLTSYASRVAVYANNRVYLLPRYAYSITTIKQLHAFIDDYCPFVDDMPIAGIRKAMREGGGDFVAARGFAYGKPSRDCDCEGCVMFGCECCDVLCSLTVTVDRY